MSNAPTIRDAVQARLAKRHRAEQRFQFYGLAAISAAVLFLAVLLGSLIIQSVPAFTAHKLVLDVDIRPEIADPRGDASEASLRRGSYNTLIQNSLWAQFPEAGSVSEMRELFGLYSAVNAARLLNEVVNNPDVLGETIRFTLPISDDADLYLKGLTTEEEFLPGAAPLSLVPAADGGVILRSRTGAPVFDGFLDLVQARQDAALAQARRRAEQTAAQAAEELDTDTRNSLEAEAQRARDLVRALEMARSDTAPVQLNSQTASLMLRAQGGVLRISQLQQDGRSAQGDWLIGPDHASDSAETWSLWVIETPSIARRITDRQIVWARTLKERGLIRNGLNTTLFTNADSREPELAGVAGALAGSILTMIVTMLLAVPIGVGAAIYLEEFAPKNRLTDFIEVNINNLAAVPSIVFGLLGLAVFINLFGMPRSAPLVGGMVLALMTLPTVIISARAALKAVPPSIREAALGVGASRTQAVFHHVLPLAMPGILTGSIIGLAQALGETAPLLMIGMVAFIADPPTLGLSGFTEPATVMPVQIYIWSSSAERAFEARTAAAILALLTLLVSFNAVAIYLRRRFERRW
ncbi:MAG: phosphate ABC transporter, permease protein PstA [Oceanicaulis sp.]|uniref:phosphate ABC transporter permease PstA n=1 Tax=unclassified Oceanicaulis TaxID=2632123 RepID=UPI000C544D4E|nr:MULTISPECIES: phosphate ABC transporter permease PstA [unclassified Oceanicaulis]MAB68247.1 phosphate ABC transporter, permease protein PstA [Oceanicaulis sp.]MBC40196.1 phosphate ABC transporter, permease protein PstA [Oceanicaulis sp.]MBG34383.1 phosphate ABC transporter, permease protein PstA [Oceanicaulis sp.]